MWYNNAKLTQDGSWLACVILNNSVHLFIVTDESNASRVGCINLLFHCYYYHPSCISYTFSGEVGVA